MSIFGTVGNALSQTITGKDIALDKEAAANTYVRTRLAIPPGNWVGSLSELEATISRENDSCERFVKDKGIAVNGARDVCAAKINAAYAPVLVRLQGEAYNQEQSVINSVISGAYMPYVIIAVVMIVLILLVTLY